MRSAPPSTVQAVASILTRMDPPGDEQQWAVLHVKRKADGRDAYLLVVRDGSMLPEGADPDTTIPMSVVAEVFDAYGEENHDGGWLNDYYDLKNPVEMWSKPTVPTVLKNHVEELVHELTCPCNNPN